MHRSNYRTEAEAGHHLVLDIWRRRKWLALVTFAAAAAAAITIARSLPDLYRARATVLVEPQQVSEAFVRPSVTAELETRIETIRQRVMSRARLTDVITRLGLYPELRGRVPFDALVARMQRDIQLDLKRIEQGSGHLATVAFTLTSTGRDPQAVTETANTLATFYVDENTKIRARQAARTAEFLKVQLDEVKRQLDAQQRRASDFKVRHDGELPEQIAVNLATLERFNTKLRLNGEQQSRAMERRERLEEQLAGADSSRAAAPSISPAAAQLLKLKQALAELRTQFSDQYPDVIRVKAEIAALEQQAAHVGTDGPATASPATDAVTRRLKQALGDVDAEVSSLKQEEAFLRKIIPGYEARIENAPKRQQELQQLSTDTDITRERYESLLKRYEEAQLAENLEQGQNVEQFRILDPALPPNGPAAPDRQLLLLMGLAMAVALAFGAVVVAEKLDTSFHAIDDLRAFVSVPTLAAIRLINTATDVRRQRRKFALVSILVIVGLALIVAGVHYIASGNEEIVRRMA